MSDDTRSYWLWLQKSLGVRSNTAEILSVFGSAKALHEAGGTEWKLSGLFNPKQIRSLEQNSPEDTLPLQKLCDTNGWQIVTPDRDDYPALLLTIPDYPAVIYVWGDLSCLIQAVPIAVVGTRSASPYGVDAAGRLCASLAEAGAVVVSGGALGVDSAAHTGALFGGGKTVAVLGCGLSANYLPGNRPLREQIALSGAVISEYPPETLPTAHNFPIRNRLISGISFGTVVIEAGERSGSLITANLALEQGRDVFAVPGNITISSFTGTNKLLRDGAKPVFSALDILEEYTGFFPGVLKLGGLEDSLSRVKVKPGGFGNTGRATAQRKDSPANAAIPNKPVRRSLPEDTEENTRLVYEKLTPEPTHIDDLVRATGLDPSRVLAALTELELTGYTELTSGKRYALI